MIKRPRIIFLGTPDFADISLRRLVGSEYDVVAVVTVPDRLVGRGRKLQPSAVKRYALEQKLEILQPEKLSDPEFLNRITVLRPDIMVVVAFRILPESLYTIPELGTFNLHASLLPRYRGAAPIHWALLNGDKETGLTTFFLQRRVDTGEIILQERVAILDEDNLGSLYTKLADKGADLVLRTVDIISQGPVSTQMQDSSQATRAPKVGNDERRIDFSESARQCHNRVRAFAPRPGAFTLRDGSQLKILQSLSGEGSGSPGEVLSFGDAGLEIACEQDSIYLLSVQPEGKRVMEIDAYLRGNPMQVGDRLG